MYILQDEKPVLRRECHASGQPLLSARSRLAHHSPLSQEGISAEVRPRPSVMAPLAIRFEAKKRFGLCVLNYIVTSNHIHLLVRDRGKGEIAQCMQLIAGRTGQEYNQRKGRKGAF